MLELSLPKKDFKIKKHDNRLAIFDRLRKRYVELTPEEWVRQNFTAHLIDELGYPAGLMGNEISLTQNGISRRCDTLVVDAVGTPLVVIEYKSPMIAISQEVFDQVVRYNSVLKAPYIIVSNGLTHYCCKVDIDNKSTAMLDGIPRYEDL